MKNMIAALIFGGVLLGACGTDEPSEPAATGNGAQVVVADFKFAPDQLEIDAGSSVVWTNEDSILHTVTSGEVDGPTNEADGLFAGELAEEGSTFSYAFEEAGTYTYFCSQHNVMNGTITVQ